MVNIQPGQTLTYLITPKDKAQYKLDEQEAATTFRPYESTHYYKFDPRIYKGEVQNTLLVPWAALQEVAEPHPRSFRLTPEPGR